MGESKRGDVVGVVVNAIEIRAWKEAQCQRGGEGIAHAGSNDGVESEQQAGERRRDLIQKESYRNLGRRVLENPL